MSDFPKPNPDPPPHFLWDERCGDGIKEEHSREGPWGVMACLRVLGLAELRITDWMVLIELGWSPPEWAVALIKGDKQEAERLALKQLETMQLVVVADDVGDRDRLLARAAKVIARNGVSLNLGAICGEEE